MLFPHQQCIYRACSVIAELCSQHFYCPTDVTRSAAIDAEGGLLPPFHNYPMPDLLPSMKQSFLKGHNGHVIFAIRILL